VPSDAQGEYVVQISFDAGLLGGKLTGRSKITVGRR
jgi:hypothetical protein